jgi:hypothetical protein
LRPNVANAPAPETRTQPSVSPLQVAGEAAAIFLLTELILLRTDLTVGGLALAGASSDVSYRAVQDVGQSRMSSPIDYAADAAGGAVMGRLAHGPVSVFTRGARRGRCCEVPPWPARA